MLDWRCWELLKELNALVEPSLATADANYIASGGAEGCVRWGSDSNRDSKRNSKRDSKRDHQPDESVTDDSGYSGATGPASSSGTEALSGEAHAKARRGGSLLCCCSRRCNPSARQSRTAEQHSARLSARANVPQSTSQTKQHAARLAASANISQHTSQTV